MRFYSVQTVEDAKRLSAGGSPWPSGLRRANLGPGFYAWDSREVAERYLQVLSRHGSESLRIVVFDVPDEVLKKMKKLDLTFLGDEEVNTWMERHSHYGDSLPHDFEYVIRNTDKGTEHYFAASVFARFKEIS